MFEAHKAKKKQKAQQKAQQQAEKAQQQALAEWQARHDADVELLELVRNFNGAGVDGLMLSAGEAVFLEVSGAALIEDRRGAGHYEGHSQGVSFPIANVGGRSIRYRVGVNKGHFVQGTPTPTAIDTGTAFITNKRVIFQGTKQTRECVFAKLIGFQHDDTGGSTTFSVSNRQKPTTIHYGPAASGTFDFRLELALAHFKGTVDELAHEVQAELDQLELQRPSVPESAPAVHQPDPGPAPIATAPGEPPAVPVASAQLPAQGPPPASQVPAGWFPDPWGQAPLRWWDGSIWTGHVSEMQPPPGS